MVKSLLAVARLFVTVPFFELLGSGLVVAAVWGATSVWGGLLAGGILALCKSFDLALDKDR